MPQTSSGLSGTSPAASPQTRQGDARAGFIYAFSAYFLWGFLPIYMKAVAHISPAEVIAHRVVWSVPVAGALLIALGMMIFLPDLVLWLPRLMGYDG